MQCSLRDALVEVKDGGVCQFDLDDPVRDGMSLATVSVEVTLFHEADYQAEETLVTIELDQRHRSSNLGFHVINRVLITVCPPYQEWDTVGSEYSIIAEPGTLAKQLVTLNEHVANDTLCSEVAGTESHYTHRDDLTERTVQGQAIRSLCNRYFVPTQDHEALPVCQECERLRDTFSE